MSAACLRVGSLMGKERPGSKGKRNTGKIKFLQLNAQHAKQAQHEINRWIDKQKDNEYIVLVQEPYLYKNKPAIQPLSAKKYYTKHLNNRTAIYTSNISNAWLIEHLLSRDATVIVCKIEGRTTVIASIYMDYNDTSPFVKDWVQDIIDYANEKGYAILLGLDSNCHSTLYGLCLLYTSPSPRD